MHIWSGFVAYNTHDSKDEKKIKLPAVLGAGASSSVAGLERACAWENESNPVLLPNRERFKFGPHDAVACVGILVVCVQKSRYPTAKEEWKRRRPMCEWI